MALAPLATLAGRPVVYLQSCDSTNRVARDLGREGGTGLVLAEHQEAGRGRLGRRWTSEPGQNLTFSLILRPRIPAVQAPRAVLIWAAALAAALDLRVKWPNDLVDEAGHKVAGLLAELETAGDQVDFIVLGVGLNVNQTSFPDLPNAASLATVRGGPQDRLEVLRAAVGAVYAAEPARDGLALWRARAHTLGRQVRVGEVVGTATGIRDDGALLIDGHPILAGDVEMVSPTSV